MQRDYVNKILVESIDINTTDIININNYAQL